MFCGLCEEACPTNSLKLSPEYELALYTREGMHLDRDKLEHGIPRKEYEK
jgi:NADH-quinone oxidoreductase subunit I